MKYKEVVEGYEPSPSVYTADEIKRFMNKNKYVLGGITLAVVIGVVYYFQKKKNRR